MPGIHADSSSGKTEIDRQKTKLRQEIRENRGKGKGKAEWERDF